MKKSIFCIILTFLFLAPLLANTPSSGYRFTESLEIPMSKAEQAKWRVGHYERTPDGISTVERIPRDQSMQSWTEMISTHFFAHGNHCFTANSAIAWAQVAEEGEIIDEDENEVILEEVITESSGAPYTLHEIIRVIWTPKGVHRVSYSYKGEKLDYEQRKYWLNKLKASVLKKI